VTPEFSRPERVDTIGEGERTVRVEADARERAGLAARFGLLALDALSAEWRVRREAAGIRAVGHVRASATQACSVTGEPVPAAVDEAVRLLFVADVSEGDAHSDIELDEDGADTLTYSGGAVDLGEAAAETVALALDPFPRSPAAADALKAAGVRGDDEPDTGGAFGALAALRDRLG